MKREKKPSTPGPIGPDVDLDNEIIRDRAGRRIDQSYLDEVVQRSRPVGRPSLTGPGERSPRVSFRVSSDVRDRAEARAKAEGRTVSDIAREALERAV